MFFTLNILNGYLCFYEGVKALLLLRWDVKYFLIIKHLAFLIHFCPFQEILMTMGASSEGLQNIFEL